MIQPLYEAVIVRVGIGSGMRLLDIGCGAGLFCSMAARQGARVTGFDAAPALIAIARQRTPKGDFQVGEMEELPFPANTFDLVTGFNSFQFAADPLQALREARRVARPRAQIVIATWGRVEDCEAAGYLAALKALLPPAPPGAVGSFALSATGALEGLLRQAGLRPSVTEEIDCPWLYRDGAAALRGLMSAGPAVKAIQTSGEDRVKEAVLKAVAPFRTATGGYRLRNKFRYVVARRASNP
ncbi:MAG TPA: methyltransferase domain-containing protein [Methylomirabilota bacterium]|nr:methyltransferase domain-containing protein [Methylomirabilota bacterium]